MYYLVAKNNHTSTNDCVDQIYVITIRILTTSSARRHPHPPAPLPPLPDHYLRSLHAHPLHHPLLPAPDLYLPQARPPLYRSNRSGCWTTCGRPLLLNGLDRRTPSAWPPAWPAWSVWASWPAAVRCRYSPRRLHRSWICDLVCVSL